MSGHASQPVPGDAVLSRYTVLEQIGEGTSSQVFRVQDTVTGLDYALKSPTKGVSAFLDREVRFWLRLSHHRNVVSIADLHFDAQDRPYLLLEYVERGTLRKHMPGRPWPSVHALRVLRDITVGMVHASSRREAAHLDLKPENVLLGDDGTAKVSDFGLVRGVERTRSGYRSVGPDTGTPGYQAPEIVLGTGPIDRRCDIYSFGLIALELLTGQSMFPRDGNKPLPQYYRSKMARFPDDFREGVHPLAALVPDYDIRVFIAGCLGFRSDERMESFEHILRALRRLGVPPAPVGLAPEHRERIQADAARRALSEAQILYRMDETDEVMQAVNRAVLFSKLDAATRADALNFGAMVMREAGNAIEARRLDELTSLSAELGGLLPNAPARPRLTCDAHAGQSRTAEPFDPWEADPPQSASEAEKAERDSRREHVWEHIDEGRFATAMRLIRSFLLEDKVLALQLASVVLSRPKTEILTAAEPFDQFDEEDPWFDCLAVECGKCGGTQWAGPHAPHRDGVHPWGLGGGYHQCSQCGLTLCPTCQPSWRTREMLSTPLVSACSGCESKQLRIPPSPTGRTRPWNHDLRAAPVEYALILRAGVLQPSPGWVHELKLNFSPDLMGKDTRGAFSLVSGDEDLLESARSAYLSLIDEGVLAADAPARTEAIYGTDADGVPFAMIKVLRSPADADKTIGLLFNISRLGGGLYGPAAFKILFRYLDPARLAGCRFGEGDTNQPLASMSGDYCIAIRTPSPEVVAYIRETMSQCPEQGLLRGEARFVEWAALTQEPLVYLGTVDGSGTLVAPEDGLLYAEYARGTKWRTKIQPGHGRGAWLQQS